MRWKSALALGALVLCACGDDVSGRIDELRVSRARYLHEAPRAPDPHALPSEPVSARLRESAAGRDLLDAGDDAVPALVRLLDDPDRRTLAAAVLAEIGGSAAARGLLDCWRRLRATVRDTSVYRVPDLRRRIGTRYEKVDGVFYAELLNALCSAGLAAESAIVCDTEMALAECERLAARGEGVVSRERTQEDGRQVELRWWPEPVETACEGLRILAASGAAETPALVGRALRLDTCPVRRAAIRAIGFLGPRAEALFPEIALLLGDPMWRDETRQQLEILAASVPDEQRRAMVGRYVERFGPPGGPPR